MTQTSELINEISSALSKAQSEIKNAVFNRTNPHFKSRYADLASIRDAVARPLIYSQKLALMMEPFDMPVTRIMTVKQKTEYLDAIFRHYSELGVMFPAPEAA